MALPIQYLVLPNPVLPALTGAWIDVSAMDSMKQILVQDGTIADLNVVVEVAQFQARPQKGLSLVPAKGQASVDQAVNWARVRFYNWSGAPGLLPNVTVAALPTITPNFQAMAVPVGPGVGASIAVDPYQRKTFVIGTSPDFVGKVYVDVSNDGGVNYQALADVQGITGPGVYSTSELARLIRTRIGEWASGTITVDVGSMLPQDAAGGGATTDLPTAYANGAAGPSQTVPVTALRGPVLMSRGPVGILGDASVYALGTANPNPAALGAQQYSPPVTMQGAGFATGGAVSMPVIMGWQTKPAQDVAAPRGGIRLTESINGGAPTVPLEISTVSGFLGLATTVGPTVQAAATVKGRGLGLISGKGGNANGAAVGGDGGFVAFQMGNGGDAGAAFNGGVGGSGFFIAGFGGTSTAAQLAGPGGDMIIAGGDGGPATAGVNGASGGSVFIDGGTKTAGGAANGTVHIGDGASGSATDLVTMGSGTCPVRVPGLGVGIGTGIPNATYPLNMVRAAGSFALVRTEAGGAGFGAGSEAYNDTGNILVGYSLGSAFGGVYLGVPAANSFSLLGFGAGKMLIGTGAGAGNDVLIGAGNVVAITVAAATQLVTLANNLVLAGNAPEIRATFANQGMIIRGNKNAADASADVFVDSAVPRTAGQIFSVLNAGAFQAGIDWRGTYFGQGGTAALPGVAIATVDKGMYDAGANILGFSVQAAARMQLDTVLSAKSTPMLIDENGTLKRVSIGIDNSGGIGFSLLRVPN